MTVAAAAIGEDDNDSSKYEHENAKGSLESDEGLPAPLPRHRLDHRVAGPVVVAKTRKASVEIGRAFEEKRVTKEYRAIVVGEIEMDVIAQLGGVSNITMVSSSSSSSSSSMPASGLTNGLSCASSSAFSSQPSSNCKCCHW